jgi:hypothetical protein
MGSYTPLGKPPLASSGYSSAEDDWFTNNYEPTAQDHSKDVLYDIGKSDVVGRYMVASKDIQPGEIIFTDEPACIGEF